MKKNWVLAGLIIALGAAVYLNWQFSPKEDFVGSADDIPSVNSQDDNLGDAQFVDTYSETGMDGEAAPAVAEAVETFSGARASRQMARFEAMDALQDIIDNPSLSSEEKSAAVQKAAEISGRIEQEAAIETLVKAKGYADCVVVISDSQVNVMVPATSEGLSPADVALIKDIVIGQVEVVPSNIKIIETKPGK